MGWKRVLSKSDLTKYPFMPQAAEYVKMLNINIDDLANPDLKDILDRTEDRVKEAILFNSISKGLKDAVELPSFPIAMMLVAATADSSLKKRYALAEAKRVSDLLKDESDEKIVEIAKKFNWKIRSIDEKTIYDFAIHFTDFLKNSSVIQDKKWKLVNRFMCNGAVSITKIEVSRLLEEEVRRYIEQKLDITVGSLPQTIIDRVNKIKRLFMEKRGTIQFEGLSKELNIAAFPPCIMQLYNAIVSGRRISHIGRFALTSFLTNTGMSVENVIDLFRSLADFDERMTRYQVEHIAGKRGSRTKYIPPRCDTLLTHGVCTGRDKICTSIRHPLAYYRRKLRSIERAPAERA